MLSYTLRAAALYNTCLIFSSASATPIGSIFAAVQWHEPLLGTLQKRAGDNLPAQKPSDSMRIWLPLLVAGLLAIVCGVIYWNKRQARSGQTTRVDMNGATVSSTANPGGVREITAAQLVGEPALTAQPRRTRRPRRTPSQISTTSLPEYMKEPGELELVIVRGPEELEDEMNREGMIRARTTIIMPSVIEDGHDSMHSRGRSESTIGSYDPMPDSPVDEPLLEAGSAPTTATTSINASDRLDIPNTSSATRRSFDSLMSGQDRSHNASSLSISRTRLAEGAVSVPQGEAPPYFEVVDLSSDLPTSSTPPVVAQTSNPNRMSSFRALFRAKQPSAPPLVLTPGSPLPATTPGHTRADSTFSNISSDLSHSRGGSLALSATQSRVSQNGSRISLSAFRTLSRQRSTNTLASASSHNFNNSSTNLNSASMISLGSISAPLSHTLVRTPFTYPKAGPTPEQLRAISTKEAYKTFGVPYGEDSIAYAERSRSRIDLGTENPPEFDFDAPGPSSSEAISEPSTSVAPLNLEENSSNQVESSTLAEAPSLRSPGLAPTSFKFPPSSVNSRTAPSLLSRSESRASSVGTFATARDGEDGYATATEGNDDNELENDDDDDVFPQVGTPRSISPQHVQESTGDTIRPTSVETSTTGRVSLATIMRRESLAAVSRQNSTSQ